MNCALDFVSSNQLRHFLSLTLLFVLAVYVNSQAGFGRALHRDNAVFVYEGQQLVNGVPLSVSLFEPRPPIAGIISGVGVWCARSMGFSDILGFEAAFLLFASLVPLGIYALTLSLFRSRITALLGAMTFFWFFVVSFSGPQPKIPMLLIASLSLAFCVRRTWFLASLCGSLAGLTWQPMFVFALVPLFLSLFQPQQAKGQFVRAAAGLILPLLITAGYFAYCNALVEFLDAVFVFPLLYLVTNHRDGFVALLRAVFELDKPSQSISVTMLGLVSFVSLLLLRLAQRRWNLLEFLRSDPFSSLLVSFPWPFLWSLFDYQGKGDCLVFLPYASIGLTWLLSSAFACHGVGGSTRIGKVMALLFFSSVMLFGSSIGHAVGGRKSIEHRLQWARELEGRCPRDFRMAAVGNPEPLVLLGKTNPSRYIHLIRGIGAHLRAREPGGIDGWVKQLRQYKPSVLVFSLPTAELRNARWAWLLSDYQQKEGVFYLRQGPEACSY